MVIFKGGLELERKFLIKELPKLEKKKFVDIEQGYLVSTYDLEVRIRRIDNKKFFQTIKLKGDLSLERKEIEFELSKSQFFKLWPNITGNKVSKKRYFHKEKGRVFEVDVYRDGLNGLKIAEIEFKSLKDANGFVPPTWLGKEVTDDFRYRNNVLATQGKPSEIERSELKDLNIPSFSLEQGLKKAILDIKNYFSSTKCFFVLIAGGSASGKTSQVALKLKDFFQKDSMVISMDDYFLGNSSDSLKKIGDNINWDHPNNLDFDLLKKHIGLLRAGKNIDKPIYSFRKSERIGYEKISPKKIIIIEGLFALSDDFKNFGNYKIFVDIGTHGRVLRRIIRDMERTGKSPAETLEYFSNVVEPMHEKYIEHTKKNADIIIKNEYNPQIEASRTGLMEYQVKYQGKIKVADLQEAGAEYLGSTDQTDYYYNPYDRDLTLTDEMIRIRRDGDKVFLTYKGPKTSSKLFERPKFEFEINKEIRNKFLSIYGNEVRVIEKKRDLYQLDGVVFSQDSTFVREGEDERRFIGDFTEIRFSGKKADEARAREIVKKLGLKKKQRVSQSYFDM